MALSDVQGLGGMHQYLADLNPDAPLAHLAPGIAVAFPKLTESTGQGGINLNRAQATRSVAQDLTNRYNIQLLQERDPSASVQDISNSYYSMLDQNPEAVPFHLDRFVASTYEDAEGVARSYTDEDVISNLTGIPKRSLANIIALAAFEKGPQVLAAASGSRLALQGGAPLIRAVPGVVPKLATGLALGLGGAYLGTKGLDYANEQAEQAFGISLPEKSPTLPSDMPLTRAAEAAFEFGIYSGILRGAAKRLPEDVNLGADDYLRGLRRQQTEYRNLSRNPNYVNPITGVRPTKPFMAPGYVARYMERSLSEYGRMARGDVPGFWMQEGAMAGGAALGAGLAEAIDPGDPLSQFFGMLLGPLGPLGLVTKITRPVVRPLAREAEGATRWDRVKSSFASAGDELAAATRTAAEAEASREVDRWIEVVNASLREESGNAATALRAAYSARVSELPEGLPIAERDAAIEGIQKELSESSRTPLPVVKEIIFEEGSSYVPITRNSIGEALLDYRSVLEEKFPGAPLDEILELQIPGQIQDPQRMPLALIVEALSEKSLSALRGRAAQGRSLEQRTGEALALETGEAMETQYGILASHLQDRLLAAGGLYDIKLANVLSRAIIEEGIESVMLPQVLEIAEVIDRNLRPVPPETLSDLELFRVASDRKEPFEYLPAEKANEFLFTSMQKLYDELLDEKTGPVSLLGRLIPNERQFTLNNFLHTFGRLKQEIGVVNEDGLLTDYSGSRGSILQVINELQSSGAMDTVLSAGGRAPVQSTPLLNLRDKYFPAITRYKEELQGRREINRRGVREAELRRYPQTEGIIVEGLNTELYQFLKIDLIRAELQKMSEALTVGGQRTGGVQNPFWFTEMQFAGSGSEFKASVEKTQDIIRKLVLGTDNRTIGAREARIAEYLIQYAVRERLPRLSASVEAQLRDLEARSDASLNSLVTFNEGVNIALSKADVPLEIQQFRAQPPEKGEERNVAEERKLPLALRAAHEGERNFDVADRMADYKNAKDAFNVPSYANLTPNQITAAALLKQGGSIPAQYLAGKPSFLQTLVGLLDDLDVLKRDGIDLSPQQAFAMLDEAEVVSQAIIEAGPVSSSVTRQTTEEVLGGVAKPMFFPEVPVNPVTVRKARGLYRALGEAAGNLSGQPAKISGVMREALSRDIQELAQGQKIDPETGTTYPPDNALLNFNNYLRGVENIFTRALTGKKRSQLDNTDPAPNLFNYAKTARPGSTPEYYNVLFELGAMLDQAKMTPLLGDETAAGALKGLPEEVILSAREAAAGRQELTTSFAEVVDDLFRGALANDVFTIATPDGQRVPLKDVLPKEAMPPPPIEETMGHTRILQNSDSLSNALQRSVFPGVNTTEFNIVRVDQKKLAAYKDMMRTMVLNQTDALTDPDRASMAPEILEVIENVLADFENIGTSIALIDALTNADSGWARALADEKSLNRLYNVQNTQATLAAALRANNSRTKLQEHFQVLRRLKNSDLTVYDTRNNMEVRGREIYPRLRDGLYNDIISIALEESGLFRRAEEGLEVVSAADRATTGFPPAQFIKDFLFDTSNLKTPAGKPHPYARHWSDEPLFDFLVNNDMVPEGNAEQLREQIQTFLGSLIELDEVFRGIRGEAGTPNLQKALLGVKPEIPSAIPGKLKETFASVLGAGVTSNLWQKIQQMFPLIGGTGGVAIPGAGAKLGRDVLGQTPRSLALPFVQHLFRPGNQEELAAFLSSPSGPSESILRRMLAELTEGSTHLLTALQDLVTREDPLEGSRGWRERLGLSEQGALFRSGSAPPEPPPVPTAPVQPPPQQPTASLQPSPASPAMRAQYAAAFPFDSASGVIRQQQARPPEPTKQGIGSLV
jgi:hypothetical protein